MTETSAPRIFVEPSGYEPFNIGDMAMLEAAFAHLRACWPHALLTAHSLDEAWIHRLDHDTAVLNPWGSRAWSADAAIVRSPNAIAGPSARVLGSGRWLRRHVPAVARLGARVALAAMGRPARLTDDYLAAIRGADLVLASGAGSLTDAFKRHAFAMLETLELAIEAGAVTALIGHGIGPMDDPVLRKRAAKILPRVHAIGLRYGPGCLELLDELGVDRARITVNGDEAIAIAYAARRDSLGTALGVNLRDASYSDMPNELVAGVSRVVLEVAARRRASIVAVPISRLPDIDDLRTVAPMLDGPVDAMRAPSTPAQLVERLGSCRAVLTGSYHAGVLALSMGIPVVAIAASPYYVHKFRGLASQFGPACRVHLAADPDFHQRVRSALDEAWETAESARGPLLAAATHQMKLTDAAYRRIVDLVTRQSESASRVAPARRGYERPPLKRA